MVIGKGAIVWVWPSDTVPLQKLVSPVTRQARGTNPSPQQSVATVDMDTLPSE